MIDRCPKCQSKDVKNVNISSFWDIPEREIICNCCNYRF